MEHPAGTVTELRSDTTDDIRLVAEVLRKDRKATAEFVSRYTDWVYAYVRRRVMPQTEVAEALVQEVFVAAWRVAAGCWGLQVIRLTTTTVNACVHPIGRMRMTIPLRSRQ